MCRSLHIRIIQVATPKEQKSNLYFIGEQYLAAEEAYQEAADHMNDALGRFVKKPMCNIDKSTDSSYRDTLSSCPLQLPRITLPKFSGKLTEWENFRGVFESLIASNDSLSNTQKLHYLKASVTGDAARLISNLQISDSNYDAAVHTRE